ncbi:hypothetical protein D9Q98_001770 [Chlorella vulgaris]|uniref:Uncharacterized protein n=1 Tax=Chlorella vulgaris TaxID=3077 RepID=A0A9D4TWD1_CHLVU|nr:hypothetical protein D9Q98_001770 [Chlorella vulgaris]
MAAAQPADAANQADGAPEGLIADAGRLRAICSLPPSQRPPLDAALRGVLAETALTGLQRYEWQLLLPLLHSLVDSVLADFAPSPQTDEEVGPPRPPLPGFESPAVLAEGLHGLLDGHTEAPFTLQRLCEVLLEPRKQYARIDKVVLALEKLLVVTSTRQPAPLDQLPPLPPLVSLTGVNCNPPSPYLDGRAPAVLNRQQHAALQQHQAVAMAAAQQHMQQMQQMQQQDRQMAGVPNGLEEQPPLAGMDDAGPPAEEAMEVDAAPAQSPDVAAPPSPPAEAAAPGDAASADQSVASAQGGEAAPAAAGAMVASPQAAGTGPVTPPEQQQQQPQPQQTPSPTGTALDSSDAATRGSAALGGVAASAPPAPPAQEPQLQPQPQSQQQQQQVGPQPMDHSSSNAASGGNEEVAAAGGGGIGEVVAQIRQHLPQSLQAVLLPPLLQQQRRLSGAAGDALGVERGAVAAAAPVADDSTAVYDLVASGLTELPPDQAGTVLTQLQPLLPGEVLQQLQQQQQGVV